MNPLKVVWFDIETVLEYVWQKVELHTPYVDLLAIPTRVYSPNIFHFCCLFHRRWTGQTDCVFGVSVVSRMPCKSDGAVNAVQ